MEEISSSEKLKIATNFISHAPPGEFNEVFNDVRILLNNDQMLKEGAISSFARYNKDQLTPCHIPGSDYPVIISESNDLGDGRFYDPRTKQSFKYDHLRKEASDFQPHDMNNMVEEWRKPFEEEMTSYTANQYLKEGSGVSVFGSIEGNEISLNVCIESHKFQPKNYWNGRWRSSWTIKFNNESKGTVPVNGILKVQVHYYEDGNVQLVCAKNIDDELTISTPVETAKMFGKLIMKAENFYQIALSENYQKMSQTTFRALRRQLPVTRTKIDWNKLAGYKIGAELKSSTTVN